MGQEEKHPVHFRGMHYPAWILYQMRQGVVTVTDLLLFALIDQATIGDEDGRGCSLSDELLAEQLGVSPECIADHIAHLRRKGLILVIRLDGQRYLELEWERTPRDRAEAPGPYGEALRETYTRTRLCFQKDQRQRKKTAEGKDLKKPKGGDPPRP